MNLKHQILVFTTMIAVSFIANAEEVYEKVNKEGVAEFSDKPSSGAHTIDVEKPNVANTLPAESTESSPSATVVRAEETPEESEQLEVIHQGVADDYADEHERRREIKQRRERSDRVVGKPVHKNVHHK